MLYRDFLHSKTQLSGDFGFNVHWMPEILFDFQKYLVEWACKKGRAAIFADCGMGKTFMQLTWAENVVQQTNKSVLILTPLAVSQQTIQEGEKLGIECERSRNGDFSRKIVVTNYQKLHLFTPSDFIGCVCDESSILKNNVGATSKAVIRFMAKMPYRLLCTATASPNDYPELGTSSEALGELSYSQMLSRFFQQLDDKGQKRDRKRQQFAENHSHHFAHLAFRVSQSIGQWRLHPYAVEHFWKWVASWARACRKPSDLGFNDTGFSLPKLIERHHIITPTSPREGWLFTLPALNGHEEREERKRTLDERIDTVQQLVRHNNSVVIWCHYNQEGDELEKAIPDARQIKGTTPDDEREEIYEGFLSHSPRVLIIKPKIGAWGLNWQHCAHIVTFASHSYEQDYQSIRRCWRFGQKSPVVVDRVLSEGEVRILQNLERKANQAEVMFEKLVTYMKDFQLIKKQELYTKQEEVPSWL